MNKQFSYLMAVIALILIVLRVQAAEPLLLQGLMRDLAMNMQTVAGAIAYQDWVLV